MRRLPFALYPLAALLTLAGVVVADLSERGPLGPQNQEVCCDLPQELRQRNIGSPPPNGPGCCVFRSIDHASRFQSVAALNGFPEWMVSQRIEGGGWPEKVDELVPRIAKSRGAAAPPYVQHTGGQIDFLYAALATGRMPCVTYAGRDMHYGSRQRIAHMVNLVHMDPPGTSPRMAAILDNNYIGATQLVWMTVAEFESRWKDMNGGWAVVLLSPPPAPVPRN